MVDKEFVVSAVTSGSALPVGDVADLMSQEDSVPCRPSAVNGKVH